MIDAKNLSARYFKKQGTFYNRKFQGAVDWSIGLTIPFLPILIH
jgi:hypothetical protein